MFVFLSGLGIALVLSVPLMPVLGWLLTPARRRRRALRAARAATVTDAREGQLVKLTGVVVAGRTTLTSPHTGRTCIAFELDEYASGALVASSRCVAFSLVVEGRLVEVSSDGADTLLRRDHGNEIARRRMGRPHETSILDERVLEVGARVTVLGVARWITDASAAYRSGEARLVLEAPARGKMLVSDDPSTFGVTASVDASGSSRRSS